MAVKQNFLDRFSERLEDLDANSRQAYILRLARERGFFETVSTRSKREFWWWTGG